MARIRSIHPGLFTDEAFMQASDPARVLLIGIWCEAWDDGVFEWKPVVLKARIFPANNVFVDDLLAELQGLDFCKMVEVGGRKYGLIRNFCRFQRPKKPNRSPIDTEPFADYLALVPNQFPTSGEKSPQMEDGGGNRNGKVDVVIGAQARDLDVIEDGLRKAAGCEQNPSPDLCNLSPIIGLLDQGADFDGEILPAIRARPNGKARSWKYFVPQIQQFRSDRAAARASPMPTARDGPKPRRSGDAAAEFYREVHGLGEFAHGTGDDTADIGGAPASAAVSRLGH